MISIIEDIVVLLSGKTLEEVQASFGVNGDQELEDLIEAITAIVVMFLQECDDPQLLAESSDKRTPFVKGILKARLYKYSKTLGLKIPLNDLFRACLDVGKKTPQEKILEAWNEINS